jgi:hypothetical protein
VVVFLIIQGRNKMKNILSATAVALTFAASTAFAGTIDVSGTVDSEYMVDAETTTLSVTPEVTWTNTLQDFELSAKSKLSIYDNVNGFTFDDNLDGSVIDLAATYDMTTSVELSVGTSYDWNAGERGDIKLKASWSF